MNETRIIQIGEPQLAAAKDHIRVFLHDCKVALRVGAYESEMHAPQTVIINLEVGAALPHHYQDLNEKSLDRVIDYAPFYDFIQKELPGMGHIPLLETVAEQIIAFCFRDPRIQDVKVRLEKPEMFEGKARAGIEVFRTRLR